MGDYEKQMDEVETLEVGKEYSGSIVKKIDTEYKDMKNGKHKVRKIITLQNGMMLLKDTYIDSRQIVGDYNELPYNEIDRPKGIDLSHEKKEKKKKKHKKSKKDRDSDEEEDKAQEEEERAKKAAEENAKKEAEEAARKEAEEVARKEAEEKARQEAEEKARKEAEEKARKEAEEKARREAEAAKRKAEEDERIRKSQEAAAERKKRKEIMENWKPEKMWAYNDKEKAKSSDGEPKCLWKQALGVDPDISFYQWKPQQVTVYPPGKKVPADLKHDPDIPCGFWCYAPGRAPDANAPDWLPTGSVEDPGILVFPPGTKPPDNDSELKIQGEWAYDHPQAWPPVPTPPKPVTVYPKNKLPAEIDDDTDAATWKFGAGGYGDDEDWVPTGVLAYEQGEEPDDLDPNLPHGVWGTAPDAQPDANGNYNPEDMWFFGVGEDPDDDGWSPRGTWAIPPDAENTQWPPPCPPPPTKVCVYPSSKVPDKMENSDDQGGMWKFGAGGDDDDAQAWEPYNVDAYEAGFEPKIDASTPHGTWGVAPGAKPDKNGNYSPKDMWLFAPGEEPGDDDWEPRGTWVPSDEASWPPPKSEPKTVTVYPSSKVPDKMENSDDDGGMWKFGAGGDDDGAQAWEPYNVKAYDTGCEPKDLDPSTPQGVWGTAPGARPDENGNYSPKDMWMFAPGEEPDDDWEPRGTWVPADDASWPPPKSEPRSVTVYPSSKVPDKMDNYDEGGMWKFGAGGDDDAAQSWEPFGVKAYEAGSEPKNLDSSTPHGVWGTAPGSKPDKNGNYSPNDMWMFAPGEEPDEDWEPRGTWVPDDASWPPKRVEPKSVTVYPSSKVPEKMENSDDQGGTWKFGAGGDGDDEGDWKPYNVNAYEEGQEPANIHPSTPHGVWGIAPGAEPDENGNYSPKDMWMFAPGEEPDDDEWTPRGTWMQPSESWPPPKEAPKSSGPKKGWVVPAKKIDKDLPNGKKSDGMWKYTAGKKMMDAGKKPVEVFMYYGDEEPPDFDKSTGGKWGAAPGAKPNADGDFDRGDTWFFAPGETPPGDDEWQPMGYWKPTALPAPKSQPKKKESPKAARKTRMWKNSVFVYPSPKEAPAKGEKFNMQGVWVTPPGASKDKVNKGSEVMEVQLHPKGHEIPPTDRMPHGYWGYAEDAKPNADGVYDPKDVVFYPPGVMPPETFGKEGMWSFPGGRTETTIAWRFEGADIKYFKKTEVFFLDTVMTFESEHKK